MSVNGMIFFSLGGVGLRNKEKLIGSFEFLKRMWGCVIG